MALTRFTGTKPQRGVRATFSTLVDAFVTWFLDTFFDELDAAITAFNFNATNSTSTDSLTISPGTKTLNAGAGKSYQKSMALTLGYGVDPTKWMRGEVLTYDSSTGAMTFNARTISQTTGTYSDWVISQAAVEGLVNYSAVHADTGNGCGSIATRIRRFTTLTLNVGTALTYADSATNGGSITVNEDGLYLLRASDTISAGVASWGISVNSNQLTTAFPSITAAHQLPGTLTESNTSSGSRYNHCTTLVKLVVGDVIRLHTNSSNDGTNNQTFLSAIKVASI